MVNPLLKHFIKFSDVDFILFPLFDDLYYLLKARLARVDRAHDLLDKGGLFCNFRELVFDILKNFHGIVLSVEDFGHDLHVAFWNPFLIPQFFQVSEGLINGLLLPFFSLTQIRLIADFVFMGEKLLLSSEGSWMRLALLRSFLSFLDDGKYTFCRGCVVCFWGLE